MSPRRDFERGVGAEQIAVEARLAVIEAELAELRRIVRVALDAPTLADARRVLGAVLR